MGKLFKKSVITRDDGKPYLIRRTLITIKNLISLKLHKIIISDDECLHDHPWAFISLIRSGGYFEITSNPDGTRNRIWYKPGRLLFRPALWTHRLELPLDKNGNEIPCKTIVITFKPTRNWGFWGNLGWVYWKNYSQKEHCI